MIGVLIGLLLILACTVGLFWNEGRAVTTARSLEEGAGLVVHVSSATRDAANEGKLVHLTGPVETDGALSDLAFAVSATGVRLIRRVEMFQWQEDSTSETRSKLGGGEETVTTYTYSRDWSDTPADSARFRKPEGHGNPPMTLRSRTIAAPQARLGAFTLGQPVLDLIDGDRPLPLDATQLQRSRAAYGGGKKVSLIDDRLYLGADPESPAIGDYRIAYEIVPLGPVSIIGRQSGDTLTPYPTKAGDRLLIVTRGDVPADEMFAAEQAANAVLGWVLRAVGLIFLFVGFMLVMRPMAVAADIVPMLGTLVQFGHALIAFCLALLLGASTIALAWFFYRPLLAIGILVAGVVLAAGILYLRRRKTGTLPPPAGMPA
ncbi:MAG: TMEM43 family protein [Alphaproteobacteria bacterium]|nr:TMEM43 family protein [Alphaproteobacteria bacterium]MBU0798714.1 TMEM43 family protein [Alphaproteobacteria bacterium]MBU0885977.1 TMEM43 family protein [Alphaproteobacteria bacterium]MBU1811966.1 TMEM43 family protein [Alphaproteobacteria bacterium]